MMNLLGASPMCNWGKGKTQGDITDELLEVLGIDRVYQDKRTNRQYIIADQGNMIFLFDVDDNTGNSDMKVSRIDFNTHFTDITADFYASLLP